MTNLLKGMILIMLLTATIQAQTTHQANVATVARAYWTLLNRAPDKDGLLFWTYEMDRGVKDAKVINYAFLISGEYQSTTQHSTECKADYSSKGNFATVRNAIPQELLTLRGQFGGRGIVGEGFDPGTETLGNTLTIIVSDCEYVLWYDYAKNLLPSIQLAAELPNSREIEVSYDPITGLAQTVKILE